MILVITYMLVASRAQALALISALKFGLIYLDIAPSMYLSFSELNMSKKFSTLSTILSPHPIRYYGFIVGPSRSNQATSRSNFPHVCPCFCPLSIYSVTVLVQTSLAWTSPVAFKLISFTLRSIFTASKLVCLKYDKLGWQLFYRVPSGIKLMFPSGEDKSSMLWCLSALPGSVAGTCLTHFIPGTLNYTEFPYTPLYL